MNFKMVTMQMYLQRNYSVNLGENTVGILKNLCNQRGFQNFKLKAFDLRYE